MDLDSVTITYCSQDCTAAPCPAGWRCEPIRAFGQDAVERACVAEPANCGDGVVQLGETCDGDDPQLGRCVDCMGYEAVCGDGVVQTGEVCDGDDPQLGRCVDCMGYQAVCGDGVVQTGEVCDGDTPAGYCVECQRVEAPRLRFLSVIRGRSQITFQEDRRGSTVYGFEIDRDTPPFTLPSEGDASGRGAAQIVETTAEYTRLSFSVCHQPGWGRATWTLGVPRALATFDLSGQLPAPYRPTHVVEAIDGSYQLAWTTDDASEVQVRTFATEDPAFVRGSVSIRMSRDDPRSSFRDAEARLEATFELLHPLR